MWIRTEDTEYTKKGLFNLDQMVALKVMEEPNAPPAHKWCLKFPFDPGHPTIKSYTTREEADVEFDKIADELEKKSSQKVMRI